MRHRHIIYNYAKVFSLSYYEALYHASVVGITALLDELNSEMPSESEGYFAETGEECYSALRSSGATIKI